MCDEIIVPQCTLYYVEKEGKRKGRSERGREGAGEEERVSLLVHCAVTCNSLVWPESEARNPEFYPVLPNGWAWT